MRWSDATPKDRHRPPHRSGEGIAHFVTGATVSRYPHLLAEARRSHFGDLIFSWADECHLRVVAWVVLKEHYHVILDPGDGSPDRLQRWTNAVHSDSSRLWNLEDGQPGRQVWYQYWDRTLWTEGDLWSRINYIHGNPVKHGYVKAAIDYAWSSLPELHAAWHDPEILSALTRFPAPMKVPNDDY